jgi:hypothetical protein
LDRDLGGKSFKNTLLNGKVLDDPFGFCLSLCSVQAV